MHRILPVAALLALAATGLYAQAIPHIDCGQPADVQLSSTLPQAAIQFEGASGESVYIRILLTRADPGFALNLPVVMPPAGNPYNPRNRDQSAGATPGDLAGNFAGENYLGLEYDLLTDGTFTLRLSSAQVSLGATVHVVLTRLNRPCGANTTLSCGHSLAGQIAATSPGQVDNYQYSVNAGDVVSFRLLRVSSSGTPDLSTFFFFAVYAADPSQNNRPYVVNVDSTSKHLTNASVYARYDWTATISGTVNVLVFEYTGNLAGSYYMSATKLSGGGCGGPSLGCNAAQDGVLTSPLTFGSYTLQANAGDVYQFRAARPGTSARAWLSLWFSFSLAGFLLLRAFAALQIDRWLKSGHLALKLAVVGHGELARQVDRQLRQLGERDLRVVGFYDPGEREEEMAEGNEHGRIRGGIARLIEDIQRGEVEEVVVAIPWSQEKRIREILRALASLSINVRICPDVFTLYLPLRGMTSVAGVAFLDVFERPLSGWDLVLKNLEDRILTPLICLVFLIPCLLIALAIKLDSRGPVLFRQTRFGFNNNPVNVLKFRTMYVDRPAEQGVPQATRNDPRVTRVGRLLRRTSLDELPQLWNVLKGEMSLVGPRPHAVDHNYKYAAMIDEYLGRHRMKPGMTGWAQVNGLRGETQTVEQMRARVQYDLIYIDNWSLWFDIRILFLTLFVGFISRRAY